MVRQKKGLTPGASAFPPSNGQIAELLAVEAKTATNFVQKALRRAARSAFLWPTEAAELVHERRSLTELNGVGPHVEKLIKRWIESPPPGPEPDPLRENFLTLPQARAILHEQPSWMKRLRGDLQMHTRWSDGSGSVSDMAEEADRRGYEYISITDHSKGLKIANGIDEQQLEQQAKEIEAVNTQLAV